jgi:hypothetical protein
MSDYGFLLSLTEGGLEERPPVADSRIATLEV